MLKFPDMSEWSEAEKEDFWIGYDVMGAYAGTNLDPTINREGYLRDREILRQAAENAKNERLGLPVKNSITLKDREPIYALKPEDFERLRREARKNVED